MAGGSYFWHRFLILFFLSQPASISNKIMEHLNNVFSVKAFLLGNLKKFNESGN